ncbi:hypothetical protein SEUCBS139899_010543 [Sporothrix eucalyptigena]
MRSSLLTLGSLLWAGVTVVATPCKPATPSPSSASSSTAPSASPSIVCTDAAILNPSFASGLDDWSTTVWSGGTFTVDASTDCGTDANGATVASCAQLYTLAGELQQSSDASINQANIPVVDGASYTLYYDYRVTAPGSGILGAHVNGFATAGGAPAVVTGWATWSYQFTASGTTASVAPFQRSYGGSMTIQVTNVRVVTCSSSGGSSGVSLP